MAELIVAMGIPGSGKSTLCRTRASELDAELLTTDPIRTEGRNVVTALDRIHTDTARHLATGRLVVIDACNLQTQQRRRWLRIARHAHAPARLLVVAMDPELARLRNSLRPAGQRVPAVRLDRYIAAWPSALATVQREPWDSIEIVQPDERRRSRTW